MGIGDDLAEHQAREDEGRIECEHDTGTRIQMFDADGWGYYLWVCDACGYTEIDDMP